MKIAEIDERGLLSAKTDPALHLVLPYKAP